MPVFALILQLLPTLLGLITSIEAVFPGAKGADKKNLLLSAIEPAVTAVHGAAEGAQSVMPVVSQTVDSLVGALNATKLWPKGVAALNKIGAAVPVAAAAIAEVDHAVSAAESAASTSTGAAG